jgi:DNA-binding transcriptional MerR regulator
MARRSGSTLRTVRFYEEAGLLKPQERTEGGHRLFTDCELKKLNLISDLRAAGFSLDEIKDLLTVKEQSPTGAHAASCLMEKLDDRLATIGERIDALQRVRTVLSNTKEMVAGCAACDHSPLFPTRCGECEVMSEAGEPAVDVLWKVDR